MDINEFRGLITLLTMATFLGICVWAYSSRNRRRFEEDALLPFADVDDDTTGTRETMHDE